jgi:hypothetical protein
LDAMQIIQLMASITVPFVLLVVSSARAEGRRDRQEILNRLDVLQRQSNDYDKRLSILEREFEMIDTHPSKPKRGTRFDLPSDSASDYD